MSNINIFYYRLRKEKNFGDELGPFIVEKLSKKKTNRIFIHGNKYNLIKGFLVLIYGILKKYHNIGDLLGYIRGKIQKQYILSAGSIIHFDYKENTKIWGSGIIKKDDTINPGVFCAVRGYKTIKRMDELKLIPPSVVGDPALILPLVYQTSKKKKYRIGIIPHIIHFDKFKNMENCDNIRIINLNSDSIENTIQEICACEYILSSSLHGLIVPHAYGIPSLYIKLEGKLNGDNIKFSDYFSSLNMVDYMPIEVPNNNWEDENKMIALIQKNMNFALPDTRTLNTIQANLLAVAPFEVDEKYLNMVNEQVFI